MLGLYEHTEGKILIDGIAILAYNVENYRHKFGIVTQKTHLFKGTIKENIILEGEADIAFDYVDKVVLLENGKVLENGSETNDL